MICGMPGGRQLAASLCRFSPFSWPRLYAVSFACAAGTSAGGEEPIRRGLCCQSSSQIPCQSGSFAMDAQSRPCALGSCAVAALLRLEKPMLRTSAPRAIGTVHRVCCTMIELIRRPFRMLSVMMTPLSAARNPRPTVKPCRQWRALYVTSALAGLCLLSGCGRLSVLSPAGPVSTAERTLLLDSLAIMLAIIIPTGLAIAAFAFWFRRGNTRARYLPDFAFSGRLELLVWSIPALTILFLGGIGWIGSHQLDPATPLKSRRPALDIQVVALDWKWLFIYPQQNIATLNRIVAPAGVPLHFHITSATVFN